MLNVPAFSIIIPYHTNPLTINFIKRQINYYAHHPIPMIVILAVSGDSLIKAELEIFLKNLKKPNFLLFFENEKDVSNWTSYINKIYASLKRVTTPYAILCAADDVVIPESVGKGIELLENNLDIAAAKGYTFYFYCKSGNCLLSKDLEISDNDAHARIKEAMKDRDSVFYIIRRTKDLINEHAILLELVKRSEIVRSSPYHIEHFKALTMAAQGKISVFEGPWKIFSIHENNSSSYSEPSFLRVERGVVDKETYDLFKSLNKNFPNLSYNHYKFLWMLHQIRGIHVTLKQIGYNYIHKKCSFLTALRMLSYFILNKIFIFIKKPFSKSVYLNNPEEFFKTEHYKLLKKYYFSKNDIELIESKATSANE